VITGVRAVIAQKGVDAKTNDITQVRPLLDDVEVTGALVTGVTSAWRPAKRIEYSDRVEVAPPVPTASCNVQP